MATVPAKEEPKEVYLTADKEIPGQHYVALSFISPNKVLKDKDVFFFSQFLKDYELQYKIKATESFIMKEALKVQEAASRAQDVLENLMLRSDGALSVEDVSGALTSFREMRVRLTQDVAADLEAHVRSEMSDFKESTIQEAYATFLFKHKKRLEEEFFAANEFRTTVQGLKVRGVYDTYKEAVGRAKSLQSLDPSFNVYVGQVGFWLPWDPEPSEMEDQEYADDQLNQLMKKYKSNESERDEFYAKTKQERIGSSKTRPAGVTEASVPPTDMFGGDDLAIARRKERKGVAENTISP